MVVVNGKFEEMLSSSIVADGQVLCEVDGGMLDATMALFASYYVFMYEYPTSLNNLFIYLQKCVFQIQDARKLPTAVITFVNAVDCEMQNAWLFLAERMFLINKFYLSCYRIVFISRLIIILYVVFGLRNLFE